MPNVVIAGAQWGDEGKGKIVDLLCAKVQVVARFNGGPNAGHTVKTGDEQFILHLLPSGVLHPGILCIMGNGMVVDPWALEKEMGELAARGVEVGEDLIISDRAHLVLPHHRSLEAMAEEQRAGGKIGTTLRGVGPAYEDKAGRRGIRMADLLRPDALPERLGEARLHYEVICKGTGRRPEVDWDALAGDLAAFGERLGPRIADTSARLFREFASGSSVLFEGAQGALLDVDHGTYPFVTSSSSCAGGVCAGLGVPPTRIDGCIGITKAYTTRVGAGPLPSAIGGSLEEHVRKCGGEYGATTGRPRRCGWFDAPVVRHSVRISGFDTLALTKLDVLDDLAEIPVCTGYRCQGQLITEFPADLSLLADCEPVYETLPGWSTPTVGTRDFDALPAAAKDYVARISELVGTDVGIISTGPERDQTVIRGRSAIAAWFA
jgi:adenylosuccinate synthase